MNFFVFVIFFFLPPLFLSVSLFLPCMSLSFSPVCLSLPPLYVSLFLPCISFSHHVSLPIFLSLSFSHLVSLPIFLSFSPIPVVSHSCLPFYFSLTPVSLYSYLSLSLSVSTTSVSLIIVLSLSLSPAPVSNSIVLSPIHVSLPPTLIFYLSLSVTPSVSISHTCLSFYLS